MLGNVRYAVLLSVAWSLVAFAKPPVEAVSPRIMALTEAVAAGKTEAVAQFWDDVQRTGTPLIEPTDTPAEMLVTFVSRGRGPANVGVMSYVFNAPISRLRQVPGTDVWALTWQVSREARATHLISWPQGRNAEEESALDFQWKEVAYDLLPDPLSRLRARGVLRLGQAGPVTDVTWFEGDQAPVEPYFAVRPAVHQGKIRTARLASSGLASSRQISVYTPPGYVASRSGGYDLLVLFDAEQYLSVIPTPVILDNMLAERMLRPLVVVFIHSGVTRDTDLPPNDRYQHFLCDELIPWVRAHYAVSSDPERVALGGFSFGALAAMGVALKRPDLFGNVISQSGSYWWGEELQAPLQPDRPLPLGGNQLSAEFARTEASQLRIYMDVGTWEGDLQIGANRHLYDVLLARGYAVTYREFEGGHDFVAWRASLPGALLSTFEAVR